MSGTQNSISSLVAQFLRLQKNALEIINGLNEVATSTNQTVQIEMLDEAGFPTNVSIPAYGYLSSQIERLDKNIQSLSGLGDNFSTIRNPDGTYSQIYKAEPLRDPKPFVNLPVPSTFLARDNWFFESFLSPLLYISIDVTGQLPDDADRILVKRIIANTETDAQKAYFDANLNGRNNIGEQEFINSLTDNGIFYFVDEEIIPLPLRTIRNKGNFGVLSFYDDTVSTTDANGQTVQETRRNYKLSSVQYTDTSTGVTNGRTLEVGNVLLTPDGTRYEIISININETSVQLKRTSGYQPVTIGPNTLTLLSTQFNPRFVDVNIGYNERQGVFFKKIDDNYNIVASSWSPGFVFWSNQLRINTTSGVQTLEQFYLGSVADLGQQLLAMAKEKKIAAISGLTPEAPSIVPTNFRVVQINTQLTQSTSVKTLNEKIALKSTLQSEISQLDNSINTNRAQINSASNTSVAAQARFGASDSISSTVGSLTNTTQNTQSLQANLNSLTQQRAQKQLLLASVVTDISTLSLTDPGLTAQPKYRVRGFWPIPPPKQSPATGKQEVIQFIIEYRYLSDSGIAPAVQQIEFLDNNGQQKTGAFSNWNKIITDIRSKVYDLNTGTYVWAPEATDDADANNINQADIPITAGEQVEIRIKSVSEAGWPDNPITSEWSEPITVSFPADAQTESATVNLSSNLKDQALLEIQQDLSSRGIDSLLARQFTSGNKNFLLDAPVISTGFTDSSGNQLDLFQVLTDMQNQIATLRAFVEKSNGVLEVQLVDEAGNTAVITKGQTLLVDGGYYNQIFGNPTTSDAGKIAAKILQLKLVNTAAGALELASCLPGGLNTLAGTSPSSSFPENYSTNLKYGEIGISITSLTPADIIPPGSTGNANNESFQELGQAPPYASGNSNSQFIYPRWKSVGLNQDLYQQPQSYANNYDYTGNSNGQPQNGSSLIPFDPSVTTVPTASGFNGSVWNGGYTGSTGLYVALGNGTLSEFCIHKNHPALLTGQGQSFTNLVKPDFSSAGTVVYPAFRQSDYFYYDVKTPNYWWQLGYIPVTDNFVTGATAQREDSMYPFKLGFESNDEWLIGKYSCGAYLFLGPATSSLLQVQGSTSLASQFVEQGINNAIIIPVIYQFRATDKLGYIGGYNSGGNPTNISYTKKLGIDIQVRNESPYSFDLVVFSSYKNETLSSPNFTTGGSPDLGTGPRRRRRP